jgi:ribose transport system substrate-binding protein
MRRFAAAAMVCAATAALAACGSSDDNGSTTADTGTATGSGAKEVRIAYIPAAMANSATQAQLDTLKQVTADDGASFQVVGDPADDPQKQVALIQAALASGKYDAIIINPLAGPVVQPALRKALDDGVAVASTILPLAADTGGNDVFDPRQTASVNTPFSARAPYLAKVTIDYCQDKDPCEVAYMQGLASLPFEKDGIAAFKKAISDHPNIKLVATPQGQYAADASRTAAANVLQANPQLNLFASVGDNQSAGIQRAIDQAGKADQVKVVSCGASELARKYVAGGQWLGSCNIPVQTEIRLAAQAVIDRARGKGKTGQVIDPVAAGDAPEAMTPDNVSDFKAEWSGT